MRTRRFGFPRRILPPASCFPVRVRVVLAVLVGYIGSIHLNDAAVGIAIDDRSKLTRRHSAVVIIWALGGIGCNAMRTRRRVAAPICILPPASCFPVRVGLAVLVGYIGSLRLKIITPYLCDAAVGIASIYVVVPSYAVSLY